MGAITIRNIDEQLKRELRKQAAAHERSMEEEAREILRRGVNSAAAKAAGGLGTRMHEQFKALGGLELEVPLRGPARPLPDILDE